MLKVALELTTPVVILYTSIKNQAHSLWSVHHYRDRWKKTLDKPLGLFQMQLDLFLFCDVEITFLFIGKQRKGWVMYMSKHGTVAPSVRCWLSVEWSGEVVLRGQEFWNTLSTMESMLKSQSDINKEILRRHWRLRWG